MPLHNFIRESAMEDQDFDLSDSYEGYIPFSASSSHNPSGATTQHGDEDQNMNGFRDSIANALFSRRES